jgi:hypothetical protein
LRKLDLFEEMRVFTLQNTGYFGGKYGFDPIDSGNIVRENRRK